MLYLEFSCNLLVFSWVILFLAEEFLMSSFNIKLLLKFYMLALASVSQPLVLW